MSGQNSHPRPLPRFSPKITIKPINFTCTESGAKQVTLVGDFNDWDPTATPMKRQPDGCWRVQIHVGTMGIIITNFWWMASRLLDPHAQGVARNEKDEKVSLIAVG